MRTRGYSSIPTCNVVEHQLLWPRFASQRNIIDAVLAARCHLKVWTVLQFCLISGTTVARTVEWYCKRGISNVPDAINSQQVSANPPEKHVTNFNETK